MGSHLYHISVDIETMSSKQNAAVLSIGLAYFTPETMEIQRTLEVRCTAGAMKAIGRDFSPETIEWWMQQSYEARSALFLDPRFNCAVAMMTRVHEFLHSISGNKYELALWAKGPNFDLQILRSLAEDTKVKWPGHYSREYCVRTMLLMAKMNGWDDILEMEPDVEHSALGDAEHQAKQIMACMKRMKQ